MAATADVARDRAGVARVGSITRTRRKALIWSYVFLVVFVIFFLTPPLYMFVTSLKSSGEIAGATNPWLVFHPSFDNYVALLSQQQFLVFFRNSAVVSL